MEGSEDFYGHLKNFNTVLIPFPRHINFCVYPKRDCFPRISADQEVAMFECTSPLGIVVHFEQNCRFA